MIPVCPGEAQASQVVGLLRWNRVCYSIHSGAVGSGVCLECVRSGGIRGEHLGRVASDA